MNRIVQFLCCSAFLLATPQVWACELTIGWEDWPPYQYQVDGQLMGLDVELLTEIASGAGCTLQFREMPWARHLKEVEERRIDLAAGASRTPEREGFGWFSSPYRDERYALFLNRDARETWQPFTSLRELLAAGMRLGITRDYFYGDEFIELQKMFPQQIEAVRNDADNLPKLLRRRIDGFLSDPMVMNATLKERQLFDQVIYHPDFYLVTGDIHILFSQRVSPEVVSRFDASLRQLKESGRYAVIVGRYLDAPVIVNR